MLSEIAAKVLHFLNRRDLDKACAVSRWLDGMIAKYCEMYPLRPVAKISLYPCWDDSRLAVTIAEDGASETFFSFSGMNEAARFAGSVLRRSYVERLELGVNNESSIMTLLADHWTTITDAIRSGAVRCIEVACIDLSALHDDALLVAVTCRGLRLLVIESSVVPSAFVTDDLLRCSVAKGVQLRLSKNKCDTPYVFSDDAILDFCFSTHATLEDKWRSLKGSGVTDMFVSKFFERLLSSPKRPFGSLKFYDAAKQRGLSAYAHYLAPDEIQDHDFAIYRFPSIGDNSQCYKVEVSELDSCMSIWFIHVSHAS